MSLALETPASPVLRRVAPLAAVDIALDGAADAHAVLGLRAHIHEALSDAPVVVLLDVSGVTRVTASAVAGLLDLLRVARASGGDLRVHGAGAISRAHAVMQLGTVLVVYRDRDHALANDR